MIILKSKKLRINYGVPIKYCKKCGDPIDVLGHMGRVVKFRNNMCLKCTIDIVKEEESI